MKRLIAVAFFLVALVVAGSLATRPKNAPEFAATPEPRQGVRDVPPDMPEDLAASKERLRQITDKMRKEFLPRLKRMPEQMKRAERLIEMNDKLIGQLSDLETTRQIRTPFDEPLTGGPRE